MNERLPDPAALPQPVTDPSVDARPSHSAPEPEPVVRGREHALQLLPSMELMLRNITDDVERAQRRVWIETFIYRDDKLGRAFGDVMARAAQRGADVRLLYDPQGCGETDPAFFDELNARGVTARPYLTRAASLRVGRPLSWDHSRVIVIDDTSYTGGAAWGDEWLPAHRGGEGWHDVCTRVAGPVVEDFARVFAQRWAEADGSLGPPSDYATGERYRDLELVADSPQGDVLIAGRYRDRVARARERVWIENAYFVPPIELLREMYAAAKRGVDVKVIVPRDSDVPFIAHAARGEYLDWMANGLQVYEYTASMVHSKFAVIDDDWATVGTFNANASSLRYLNEVNLFVRVPAYVARVARLFESDLRYCERMTPERMAQRPLVEKVVDAFAASAMAAIEPPRGRMR